MTEVLDRPRTATRARAWVAVVVTNGILGGVGAVAAHLAVALALAAAYLGSA